VSTNPCETNETTILDPYSDELELKKLMSGTNTLRLRIDDPLVISIAKAFPWRVKTGVPLPNTIATGYISAMEIDISDITRQDLIDCGLTPSQASAILMDYLDHIEVLMKQHGSSGYYHKDNGIIGFPERGGIVVWYRQNGKNQPTRIDSNTPEERFKRLNGARFNRLRR